MMNRNYLSENLPVAMRSCLPESSGVALQLHSFSRNEEIYSEGEKVYYWYRIITGTVRACNLLADGRRHIAEFFFPNDFFGFSAEEQYLTSAEAVNGVVAARYPCAVLEHLSQTDPYLAQRLHSISVKSLADVSARMVLLARKTAHERMASFLLDMADRSNDGCCVDLPMTRHDIADHLGLTYETVCRVISGMKRADTIKVLAGAHKIELIDYPALTAMRAGRQVDVASAA